MANKDENLDEKKKVILQWKKKYLEALIDELKPQGDVLEVGFGYGDAANRIQSFKPTSHTIIESDPTRAKEARAWAKQHQNVNVIEGFWQNHLPGLGMYDAIFFNDYPIEGESGMINRIKTEEISMTSEEAKELLDNIENQLSQFSMHYSDKDIEDFYKKTGQNNLKALPGFFKKLQDYGFITEEQCKETIKKYHLEKSIFEQPSENSNEKDPTLSFLEDCLKNHMRKGSRFSCFSPDITTKYEDTQFFENIITNPYLDYFEKIVSIDVPKFSDYFKFDNALIFVVEKFN